METKYVAFTANGSKHYISELTASKIYALNNEDMAEMEDGTMVKVSTITAIMPIDEFEYQFPEKRTIDYHQPYTVLPAIGFTGLISREKRLSALEGMARGLKKAKDKLEKQGRTTFNIDALLKLARVRYAKVKKELAI
jgi:hypothetical protein